jgi:hypothetical protein
LCVIEGLGHGFLNRTHLDDAPPRLMTVTRHVPGSGDRVEDRVQSVFPTIEAFFRAHLASDAVADRAPAAAER